MTDLELYLAVKQVQAELERRIPTSYAANEAFKEADIAVSDALLSIECGECHKAPVAYRDIKGVRCEACEDELIAQERIVGVNVGH